MEQQNTPRPVVKEEIGDEASDGEHLIRAAYRRQTDQLKANVARIADLEQRIIQLESERQEVIFDNSAIPRKLEAQIDELKLKLTKTESELETVKEEKEAAIGEVAVLQQELQQEKNEGLRAKSDLDRMMKKAAEAATVKQKKLEDELAKERKEHGLLKAHYERIRHLIGNPPLQTPGDGAFPSRVAKEEKTRAVDSVRERKNGRGDDNPMGVDGEPDGRSMIANANYAGSDDGNGTMDRKPIVAKKSHQVLGKNKEDAIVSETVNPPAQEAPQDDNWDLLMHGLKEESEEDGDDDDWKMGSEEMEADSDEDDSMDVSRDGGSGKKKEAGTIRKCPPRRAKEGNKGKIEKVKNVFKKNKKRSPSTGEYVIPAYKLNLEGLIARVVECCTQLDRPINREQLLAMSSKDRCELLKLKNISKGDPQAYLTKSNAKYKLKSALYYLEEELTKSTTALVTPSETQAEIDVETKKTEILVKKEKDTKAEEPFHREARGNEGDENEGIYGLGEMRGQIAKK